MRETPAGASERTAAGPGRWTARRVFSHPDCDRRLRHWTGSADPGRPRPAGRSRARAVDPQDRAAPTAGGELHPAPKTFPSLVVAQGDRCAILAQLATGPRAG